MITLWLQSIALVGGTVHSMVPGAAPVQATVAIEGTKIFAVGPSLELPERFQEVDVTGLHLVPGLIDGMINHDPDHDALYLAAGVTLCRDTGNDISSILTEASASRRQAVPGPELFICGQVFDGLTSASTDALRLMNPEVVPAIFEQLFGALEAADADIDYINFQPTLPTETWRVLLQEASTRQKPVWGPLPGGIELNEALTRGQAGFLGMQVVLPPGGTWLDPKWPELHEGIGQLRDAGAGVTPLLSAYARMLTEPDVEKTMQRMGPYYESPWMDEWQSWQAGLTETKRAELETVVAQQSRILLAMHESGIALIPGSAAPNPWIVPGQGLLDELNLWHRAGIPRGDVLAYATREAARNLGLLAERGTLEPGKVADIVALGSDPNQSLDALRNPQLVVIRGQVVERSGLLNRVRTLEGTLAKLREELNGEVVVPPPNAEEGDLVLQGEAETWTLGTRLCSEHFVVRRIGQDEWLYATRMIYPGNSREAAKEVHLVQVMEDSLLKSFDMRISAVGVQTLAAEAGAPDTGKAPEGSSLTGQKGAEEVVAKPLGILQVRGRQVEGTKIMNIEHRKDGFFVSSLRAKDRIASIDVSLPLNALICGKHFPVGASFVVTFEGGALEPVTDRWTLGVRDPDGLIQVQSSRGALAFGFDGAGRPLYAARQRGTSQMEVRLKGEPKTFGGGGLGLPPERIYQMPEAPADPKQNEAEDTSPVTPPKRPR